MAITIKKDAAREVATLATSNMTDKEYVIVEKLYDTPKTGSGTNAKGAFEWRLYGVKVIEYKTMDEATESMKVFKPNVAMSYFNNGKSFVPAFDALPVGAIAKITQYKKEGSSYRSFKVEVVSADKPAPAGDISAKAAALKVAGLDVATAAPLLAKEFGVTVEFATARFNAQ